MQTFIPQALYPIIDFTADVMRGLPLSFFRLTGYFGQEDYLYFGREALSVHFLGRRSNYVTTLSTERIRGVFDFILYLIYFYILLFEHWGQCSS